MKIDKFFNWGSNPNNHYKSGLYLIGTINYDIRNGKVLYFVKVGKSTNLKRRIKEYDTHNPFMVKIGYKNIEKEKLDEKEKLCHDKLKEVGFTVFSDEWFCVSETVFYKIYNRKWKFFF